MTLLTVAALLVVISHVLSHVLEHPTYNDFGYLEIHPYLKLFFHRWPKMFLLTIEPLEDGHGFCLAVCNIAIVIGKGC